ncbi:hypothetical protein BDV96DRAFT_646719 [Lophiotrema nucula]|uniref:SH3 domain-containing protein n=1 Tax=Lophiotrema nucula TaxID=690887 RepID=A0A6A5Z5X1_9PLEO|nr:hypothetical protein BDV96DRAFT_646719 [Lophiotrema nucula]
MEKGVNGVTARALHGFQAQTAEHLSFVKGDILAFILEQKDGLWSAEILGHHHLYGLVPSNYLEHIDGIDIPSRTQLALTTDPSDDTQAGLLQQRWTAFYDYASEKQLSSEAKQF